jgi:hypothetical protein
MSCHGGKIMFSVAVLGVLVTFAPRSAEAQVYVSDTYRVSNGLYAFVEPLGFNPYGPMSEVLLDHPHGPTPRRPVWAWWPMRDRTYNPLVEADEQANWPCDFPADYSGEAWWMADPMTLEDDIPSEWYSFWGRFPYPRFDPRPLSLNPSLRP